MQRKAHASQIPELTPGDAPTVLRRLQIMGDAPSLEQLVAALAH